MNYGHLFTGEPASPGNSDALEPKYMIRIMLTGHADVNAVTRYAGEQGFTTLRDDAYCKVQSGLTSLEEIFRVLGPE